MPNAKKYHWKIGDVFRWIPLLPGHVSEGRILLISNENGAIVFYTKILSDNLYPQDVGLEIETYADCIQKDV